MENEEALGQRIAQIINGECADMSACDQTFGDHIRGRRLIKLFREGGIDALRKDNDLYNWAKNEFENDAPCFSFKLWLAAHNA